MNLSKIHCLTALLKVKSLCLNLQTGSLEYSIWDNWIHFQLIWAWNWWLRVVTTVDWQWSYWSLTLSHQNNSIPYTQSTSTVDVIRDCPIEEIGVSSGPVAKVIVTGKFRLSAGGRSNTMGREFCPDPSYPIRVIGRPAEVLNKKTNRKFTITF